jgi:hypothetical protein
LKDLKDFCSMHQVAKGPWQPGTTNFEYVVNHTYKRYLLINYEPMCM